VDFDPYYASGVGIKSAWMEKLVSNDWTLDPAIFNYQLGFSPSDYIKGFLAASWEITDPGTYIIHLRHGITWQNIAPASGRELVAADVVFHYTRDYGIGGGTPAPLLVTNPITVNVASVIDTDKYTVVFKWKTTNPEFITETMDGLGPDQFIENPDAVKQWGDVRDWHHAIGTGPFILTDFVSGSSATLVKNPGYWGTDERYPQNKLPYVQSLKFLIIVDNSTAMAALRSGKIDLMTGLSLIDAQNMQKTNPELIQITTLGGAASLDPRVDTAPFNNINVRIAFQKAINLPLIASSYYKGTASPYPSSMTSSQMTGWGWPYSQWPQDLKDEYAYDPAAARKLLADAGYPTIKTDIVADSAVDQDLLTIVQSQLADANINMEIRLMDSASWTNFVRNTHKYDALAQATSAPLGFSYEPIRQLNRFTTGYAPNYNMVSDAVYDTYYPKAMASTDMAVIKQALRDANERVARQHWVISLVQGSSFQFYEPWLSGYNGQNSALTGASSGAQLIFFYGARFWVNQDLKKSMGH
jgi:peptide/nickel transport system substrate-binding protein